MVTKKEIPKKKFGFVPAWEEQHRPMSKGLHVPGKSPPNQALLPVNIVHFRFHLYPVEEHSGFIYNMQANKIGHSAEPQEGQSRLFLGIHGDPGHVTA